VYRRCTLVGVSRRRLQLAVGFALVVAGAYLVAAPVVVAEALGRPHATPTQMINLRASWGGVVVGLGAFIAWLPAPKPWPRAMLGLLLWAMAGIGIARAIGFVVDGHPDGRQWIWITAEGAIVLACALGLRRLRARR
jgi:hypothetical protein